MEIKPFNGSFFYLLNIRNVKEITQFSQTNRFLFIHENNVIFFNGIIIWPYNTHTHTFNFKKTQENKN